LRQYDRSIQFCSLASPLQMVLVLSLLRKESAGRIKQAALPHVKRFGFCGEVKNKQAL
jgi:hypothetical protein